MHQIYLDFDGQGPGTLRMALDFDALASCQRDGDWFELETPLAETIDAAVRASTQPGGGIGAETAAWLGAWADTLEAAAARLRGALAEGE